MNRCFKLRLNIDNTSSAEYYVLGTSNRQCRTKFVGIYRNIFGQRTGKVKLPFGEDQFGLSV